MVAVLQRLRLVPNDIFGEWRAVFVPIRHDFG